MSLLAAATSWCRADVHSGTVSVGQHMQKRPYLRKERVGIIECCHNLIRLEAEQWAETIVRAAYSLRPQSAGMSEEVYYSD